jgi:NADPH:quinone reductase-like Zn-dependent oxidoreductase
MKAIVWTAYGPPDVLQLQEVEKPAPKDNEVLIKIHATTVTAGDCELRSLRLPIYFALPLRLWLGLRRPKETTIPGTELAGEVEAVGKDVKRFQVGDQVFGSVSMGLGTNAEYICLPEEPEEGALALKPANMTYEQAATVPFGGCDALHFLRKGDIQPGETLLINGAGGSIGTFAVQLAKHMGAHVTAVDSAEKLDMLRSIGADAVIDYAKDDFTESGDAYDVIFDVVGKSSFSRSIQSLKPNGRYLLANPRLPHMFRGLWTSMTSDKKVVFEVASGTTKDLVTLRELVEAGTLKTVIDRRYPLEQTADAHRYVETGRKMGNVVVTVARGDNPTRARPVSEVHDPSRHRVTDIIDIEGIGPVYAEKLREIGIKTTIGLLEAGSTSQEREEIAEKTGISPRLILEWVNMADLMRIKGVGEEYSDLLEEVGVESVVALSQRNPEDLHARLCETNREKRLVRRVPSLNAVERWVALARADNELHDLFLRYDENLKGGAHAVKSDDTSRPRNRFSGGEMDLAIGLRAHELPVAIHPQESLNESVEKASERHDRDYESHPELVEVIERAAYELGAELVGFTEVTPSLVYAGKEVPYRYVIVVAMRMDSDKIATAPSVECGIETAYITGVLGVLVNRLCDKIKETGHDAVPGPALGGAVDYPSLARMAGMGEYGRHGLLISPYNGACQRIAGVFTNLELPVEKSNPHTWIRDFCSSCGKCIRACPCNAIREESVPTKAGHYSCVDTGRCLLYLVTHLGCSICIKECPFTTMGYDRIKEAVRRDV